MGIQPSDNDIFSGLTPAFIEQMKMHASTVSCRKGGVLFRQGDTASHFFTLIKGHVALCIGRRGHVIYKVGQADEGFGWSSLTGCDAYTASAVCIADTAILKYEGRHLKALLAGKSLQVLRFYQNLSRTLDRRLAHSYGLLSIIAEKSKIITENDGYPRESFDLL